MRNKPLDLNYTSAKTDLRIYKNFHITAKDYTFFSSAHKTFSKNGRLQNKVSKFKKTEIIPFFLTKMARNKKINNRKKMGKFTNM